MEETIQKVIRVINSCETLEQLRNSKRFVFIYLKSFTTHIEYYNQYDELMRFFNTKRSEITLNG
jgi:hypothetical protein